jgi:hypothetical protein
MSSDAQKGKMQLMKGFTSVVMVDVRVLQDPRRLFRTYFRLNNFTSEHLAFSESYLLRWEVYDVPLLQPGAREKRKSPKYRQEGGEKLP